VGLHQVEFPNVAGERGLSHVKSTLGEMTLQFLLALNRALVEELKNDLLSGSFTHNEYLFI
jgi:hypothetical protein